MSTDIIRKQSYQEIKSERQKEFEQTMYNIRKIKEKHSTRQYEP